MKHDPRIVDLAIGRIFRLCSRPAQPGDVEEYERCRRIILDNVPKGIGDRYEVNWARDRMKGAQGD